MGEWCSLVLVHTAGLPDEFTDWDDDLESSTALARGWVLLRFGDTDLAEHPLDLLHNLAASTGAPALTALEVDSDELDLAGDSAAGQWRAIVPAPGEPDPRLHDHFAPEPLPPGRLTGTEAATAIAAWARAAQLPVHHEKLTRLCNEPDPEILAAGRALDHLLDALGLTPGSG